MQLQLALAMSREEHEEAVRKQKSDDIKLQLALDESRRQQVEEVGTRSSILVDFYPLCCIIMLSQCLSILNQSFGGYIARGPSIIYQ